MATALLTRRFMSEYVRRPLNVVLLVVVPVIFVILAAGAISDFASIVGFVDDPGLLAGPTAGWAATFLAGVAGFFHVLGSRDRDRRLSAAGMGATRITSARLVSGLLLAVVAAGSAVGALWLLSLIAMVHAGHGCWLRAVNLLARQQLFVTELRAVSMVRSMPGHLCSRCFAGRLFPHARTASKGSDRSS
jgi:hypothetical protein